MTYVLLPCLVLLFLMSPYCHSTNIEGRVDVEGSSQADVTLTGQFTAKDNKILSRSGGINAGWKGELQEKRIVKTEDKVNGKQETTGVRILNAGARGSAGDMKGLNKEVGSENDARSELDKLKQFAVDARDNFDKSNFDSSYYKYGGQ